MSDENAAQPAVEVPIPDGWADMTEDEQKRFVADALTEIAQGTGVTDDVDAPADTETGDGETGDTGESAAADSTPRVFREPGQ